MNFVHITKTGGTFIETFFKHNKCNVSGYGHDRTEKFYEISHKPIFAIIRNPVERMFSQFYYWKNGAANGKYQRSNFQKQEHHRLYPTLSTFIDAQINDSLLAKIILNYKMQFTWNDHFKPQNKWLDGEHRNTWLICFDKLRLAHRVNKFLKQQNIACQLPNQLTNPTVPYENETIRLEHYDWLKKQYLLDFQLWNLCHNKEFIQMRLN
jgi:hypothetical protein